MWNTFQILSVCIFFAVGSDLAAAYSNVYGEDLQPCSQQGMSLTGFTRNGHCVDQQDDIGSHHICIDLGSASGGNFCQVTGQPNWCAGDGPCDGGDGSAVAGTCPIRNWCVCQWAFASYLERAGGCDAVQEIVCEAINKEAVTAYRKISGERKYGDALRCIEKRCGVSLQESAM
mmetsp:Transcript_24469/g.48740  ORF Transcript_24469/g.48740 Transcript_24469/m.48740 type:complete len:174 (+) Transcript_24469:114-635(+)